jgi:hydrogenase expression/formation protein HypD
MDKVVASDCENIHRLCERLALPRRRVQIMEICGTHTMSIARAGLKALLPPELKLISGPGCPVCVTDQSYMDQAIWLSRQSGVVIATYGDMVRVPGRHGSLAESRAGGAAVEVVYSAQQAVELARTRADKQVVFLAVGFETTAPGTGMAIQEARDLGLKNFSALTAHKLVLPAMRALLSAGDVRVDGFLCPGHVSVILGYDAYREIAENYRRPCVVAGFDPRQVLAGLTEILRQLVDDKPQACTVYPSVTAEGNLDAQRLLDDVFQPGDAAWRAIGVIPQSGLVLKPKYAGFDAAARFDLPQLESYELPGCRCGDVICGRCSPFECDLFGRRCTPRDPVGPCMVSSEGACAAAYKYELPLAKTA